MACESILSEERISIRALLIAYPVVGIAIVFPNGSSWVCSLDSKSGRKQLVRGKIIAIIICISARKKERRRR